MRVYLDWNATTPPRPEVVRAMTEAARTAWGNPSSVHAEGRTARSCVEGAREAVAAVARCDPRDVFLTSGGTEANNLALRSVFARGKGAFVVSQLEHPSVTRVAEALEREGLAEVCWWAATPSGEVDLEHLARLLARGNVRLVALQAANHETGVLQPVARVAAAAHRAGALVHVDAVQVFGRSDDVAELADTRSLAAHKMRGPKGIGAVIARPGLTIDPILLGGSQERGVRPGTIDPVAAAGLAVAARLAVDAPVRWQSLGPLRDELEASVLAACPGATVNGAGSPRMPHVSNVAFPGWASPELVAALDLEGVSTSGGSACSAGTAESSRVLVAMGNGAAASSSVRFSLGDETTQADVSAALEALERILRRRSRPTTGA
jgi:cysteine desulfurase